LSLDGAQVAAAICKLHSLIEHFGRIRFDDAAESACFKKLDLSVAVVEAGIYALAAPTGSKLRKEEFVRLDADAGPREFPLEQQRVVRTDPVGGAGVEEVAVSLMIQYGKDELVLTVLRAHRRARRLR